MHSHHPIARAAALFFPLLVATMTSCGSSSGGSQDSTTDATEEDTASPEPTSNCGNGTVEDGEECDDANGITGDGCEADCTFSCRNHGDCDDGDDCTDDMCTDVAAGMMCSYEFNLQPCEGDGDLCTADVCDGSGNCVSYGTIECTDDGNPCTLERCDPSSGCIADPAPSTTECEDSDPCTDEEHCLEGSCVSDVCLESCTWYEDGDEDGYGNPESPPLCQEDQPTGYVNNSRDCCDTDDDVHPGQHNYFSEASTCGSFDYNCNGEEDKEYENGGSCYMPDCRTHPGWYGPAPACGHEGAWLEDCHFDPAPTCVPLTILDVLLRCR